MRVWKTAVVGALAVVALETATVRTAAQGPFASIVAFGTSLSDSGNAFALRGGTNTPPDYLLDPLLVPSAPYARGGHHFSNGATWIEQFARSQGLAGSARPAYRSSGAGTNYAVGAARAYEDGRNLNLSAQVDAFLGDVGGVAPSDALYTIEIGGNDIRDALVAYPTGHGAILRGRQYLDLHQHHAAVCRGRENLHRLARPQCGTDSRDTEARHNESWRGTAGDRSHGGLQHRLSTVSSRSCQLLLPGIRIVRLDAFGLLQNIVNTPDAFGLTDVTSACVTPGIATLHVPTSRRVSVLGRHPSDQGRARDHRERGSFGARAVIVIAEMGTQPDGR